MTSTIEINRLSDVIGAEIIGIDLNTLDDTTFDAINDAYLEHQMLCVSGTRNWIQARWWNFPSASV